MSNWPIRRMPLLPFILKAIASKIMVTPRDVTMAGKFKVT